MNTHICRVKNPLGNAYSSIFNKRSLRRFRVSYRNLGVIVERDMRIARREKCVTEVRKATKSTGTQLNKKICLC